MQVSRSQVQILPRTTPSLSFSPDGEKKGKKWFVVCDGEKEREGVVRGLWHDNYGRSQILCSSNRGLLLFYICFSFIPVGLNKNCYIIRFFPYCSQKNCFITLTAQLSSIVLWLYHFSVINECPIVTSMWIVRNLKQLQRLSRLTRGCTHNPLWDQLLGDVPTTPYGTSYQGMYPQPLMGPVTRGCTHNPLWDRLLGDVPTTPYGTGYQGMYPQPLTYGTSYGYMPQQNPVRVRRLRVHEGSQFNVHQIIAIWRYSL